MKAFRVQTGLRIEPFGDPVSEAFLGGEDLGTAVVRALTEAGMQAATGLPDDSAEQPCLLLPDRLFVTRAAVRAFVQACPAGTGVYRLGLARGPATDWAGPLQQTQVDQQRSAVLFDLYLLRDARPPAGAGWPELRAWLADRARPVVIDPGTGHEPIFTPRPGARRQALALPRTDRLAVDVCHWVHILWLNQALPWVRLAEHRQDHPWRAWLRSPGGHTRPCRIGLG